MAYETKNYENLLGTAGFSDTLLKNHFTLYDGYVKNTNKVFDLLSQFAKEGKTAAPEYAELKRRFGWEFNGMRLHELYFGNLKKGGRNPSSKSDLADKIAQDFGSFDGWLKDFKSTGTMRGIGWTVLTYDYQGNRLFNVWVNEHDAGHLAGTSPLLILDVFEHAYMLDYGLKRADYIEAFLKALDWDEVEKRFSASVALKESAVH
ncbi:MAG: Fe-Mn family superoxide dismutase [Candidatus Omnitrophica bacterium]|nr:Fe-Mn family superoxide dismutase [Candidatus Omnitrophota bacterium]MDD5670156.1 Fe-Mn family superoxide dismutase [Candidatus Omnitrophota bacterium]